MAENKSTSARAASAASSKTEADIQAQIDQLRGDIANLTKLIGDLGSEKASQARARAEKLRDDATKAGQEAYDRARDEALSMEEDLEDRIRMKPLQSILIAAGVGFLAALFTRR
ncbi:DUF883 family protein [Martelella endophytica]|uniref:DUF883 domain-containing protein n=1 Tax=Martelella endophytica TaxID=1486262 RepID=A0A0D5LNU5_MAREN|nr:DUF883 family protein [Martelella endophytica]AJY45821.1 hypothetical protein TM49_09185 [Martelella endophytica]